MDYERTVIKEIGVVISDEFGSGHCQQTPHGAEVSLDLPETSIEMRQASRILLRTYVITYALVIGTRSPYKADSDKIRVCHVI